MIIAAYYFDCGNFRNNASPIGLDFQYNGLNTRSIVGNSERSRTTDGVDRSTLPEIPATYVNGVCRKCRSVGKCNGLSDAHA